MNTAQELRAHILGQSTLRTQDVECPEWGCTITIREMSGKDRDAWEASLNVRGKVDISNIRARLVSFTAVKDGVRIFSNEDAVQLGNLSAKALDRCVKVAQELNALTEKELDAAKENSSGDPSADSTSGSQPT
jgi:hypothetical protein